MSATEYMARTVVNFPFIEERYEPGAMIPFSVFERYADEAAKVIDDRTDKDADASPLPTAEDVVKEFANWGTITDNPEDGLHPDHVVPDPSRITLASLVSQAEALVAEMEDGGLEVPAKLRALAEISDKQISSVESAVATERAAGGESE